MRKLILVQNALDDGHAEGGCGLLIYECRWTVQPRETSMASARIPHALGISFSLIMLMMVQQFTP